MYIETTINIDSATMKYIEYLAKEEGASRSYIIKGILKRYLKTYRFSNSVGKRVRYQETSGNSDWHRFHISFSFSEYELFKDIPRVCKVSLAHFLALALKKYRKDRESNRCVATIYTDNYLYTSYVFMSEVIDGILSWRIYWGMPGNIP